MASVNIYDADQDRTYTVAFDLRSSGLALDGNGNTDIYLDVSTTITRVDGTSFGHYVVRNLTDVPPGGSVPAPNFSNLCSQFITYFMNEAELIVSSSSSSWSSSSSSSERYTSSSSSSSGPHP